LPNLSERDHRLGFSRKKQTLVELKAARTGFVEGSVLGRYPETHISEAVNPHFWATDFATISRGDLVGVLGKARFLGKEDGT
jgi:hypothetical protein